jgi:PIN domain nuclease of toxin-antitoxin system
MARADIMAGRAYVSLYVKRDLLSRGLQQAKENLSKFGSDMMQLGTRMVAMSAAIAAPLGLATKTFADFDDAMRSVGAVSRATAADLLSMTNVAKELGRTTSFTAVQVASLMTELGRAGFSPDQINVMTGAVLNLARATGTDATLASGIMSASIRQFGLEAADAARVAARVAGLTPIRCRQ